jgi:Cu/Ag efflux protein CusF
MRLFIGAVVATIALGAHAQDKKAPTAAEKGKVALEMVRVTATVESIDQATRAVTLKDSKGDRYDFVAGPDVRNLAQVSAGDVVTIEYGYGVAMKLDKTPNNVRARTVTEAVDRAAVGQMPGGVIVRQVDVVASVEAIDTAKPSITLRGPERTITLKVNDPAMLKGVKKGDFVAARYTEAMAIKVEKAAKK